MISRLNTLSSSKHPTAIYFELASEIIILLQLQVTLAIDMDNKLLRNTLQLFLVLSTLKAFWYWDTHVLKKWFKPAPLVMSQQLTENSDALHLLRDSVFVK